MNNNNPIGIFDSGIGGLSVFSKLIKLLPNENYIYFGDTKNLPYGNKTKEELIKISTNIFDFFNSQNVKAVVMACNTTSANVYDELKSKYNFEIYPVIQNVSKIIAAHNYNRLGILATEATIKTHAYKREINSYNPNIKVFEFSCPKWVHIVENSLQDDKESLKNIEEIINSMLSTKVEKIILGCTHYPYLLEQLAKFAPKNIFIDPSEYFAQAIFNDLKTKNLLNNGISRPPLFLTSSNPNKFIKTSKLFYKVESAKELILNSKI